MATHAKRSGDPSRPAARRLHRRLAGLRYAPAAALALLLCACGHPRPPTEVLHFWAVGVEAEALAQLLPEFERSHPNVRIEVQQLAWTAAHEKLLTAVAGDATPDLCQLGNTWIPELVALRALEPLQARVAASRQITRDDYFPGVWQPNVLDGVLYGVPWYVDTRLLFYRSDLLRQAGFGAPAGNWADWLKQMQAIKRLVGKDRYAVLLPLNQFEPLQVLALEQPEPMLRDDNRYGNFRSASFRRALAFYHSLFAQSLAPVLTETQIANVWSEFGRGYFSFYVSGPWNIAEFKRRLPPAQQGSWMTAPMPGPDGPGVSSAGGSSLVIFSRSRHKEAAFAVIEYLSQPEVQQRFHALTGDLPPRRSSWQSGAIANDPYTRAFRAQLERLRAFPQLPEWEQIMQAMRLMGERVARGEEREDEATAKLDAEVDAMLAKRRWLLARRKAQS
ncbi:MAG: sugar ABC transporter substrate-binding protein [Gammaproteobacteria bacterium]|nr:sugar ABC transporter substrate-binding protein [Gammaproteobacteria bacterium]MDE2250604.1 sugar ABC transporter substrate-binding protein [Gammaproteobacteria bacterium]